MDARIKSCFPEMPPMVGFASTATFRSSAPPRSGDVYADLAAQIARFEELSGPAVVVFQDLDNPPVGATFGEVMTSCYQAFGSVGLITSGAGRDLDQVRALGYPVFTNGTICSHGYPHTPQVHVPVHVGGIVINPDDLLHGDCNGVTTIPVEIASEVADVGHEYIAAEQVVLDVVRGKHPNFNLFAEARSESRRQIDQLRAKVSRKRKS
jgi:regulator of RNase E activity RraA